MLKLVIAHYPVKSILDIGTPLYGPWLKKYFTLLSKTRSLREVERDILRKHFSDPRIHFALNCASISCPSLRAEPYVAQHLHEQLDDAGRTFLKDERKNLFDREKRRIYFSKIFKWYKRDFEYQQPLIDYLARFLKTIDRDFLQMKKMRVHYMDYDWRLNDAAK